jgi:hypothetical protein
VHEALVQARVRRRLGLGLVVGVLRMSCVPVAEV